MTALRFHFLDGARGEDAAMAASILADSLSRQGYAAEACGSSVQIQAELRRESEPEEIYLVLHEELLADPNLLSRLDRKSAVVVCSARPARVLCHELGRFTAGVTTVDADGIAMDEGADPVVVLLGGAARALPVIDPDALCASVWHFFDRDLPYAAHAAIRAFDLGYMQAQQAI